MARTIFHDEKSDKAIPMFFKWYKARSTYISALSAEVIYFSNINSLKITTKRELESSLNMKISLQLLSDSNSLFDIISKMSSTPK